MSETEPKKQPPGAAPNRAAGTARDADRLPPGQPAAGEIGGADGPEPTRYGDWERNGRCTDF